MQTLKRVAPRGVAWQRYRSQGKPDHPSGLELLLVTNENEGYRTRPLRCENTDVDYVMDKIHTSIMYECSAEAAVDSKSRNTKMDPTMRSDGNLLAQSLLTKPVGKDWKLG